MSVYNGRIIPRCGCLSGWYEQPEFAVHGASELQIDVPLGKPPDDARWAILRERVDGCSIMHHD